MQEINTIILIVFPILAFMLGSVPWGIIITRTFCSIDVRKHGSGNIGATNVRRIAGTVPGLLTLFGDVLKGAIPVYISGFLIIPENLWHESYASLIAFSAFLGHLYPAFTRFRAGGKGVATAAGCFLILNPLSVLIAAFVFVLVIWLRNYVSAGSLSAAAVLPIAVLILTRSIPVTLSATLMSGFIFIRHRENIKRLINGTEAGFRSKGS